MAAFLVSATLAGAVAAAIALAPNAFAEDSRSDGCRGSGCSKSAPAKAAPVPRAGKNPLNTDFSANLPQGWKNEALWAGPGKKSGPLGPGPRPPVVALD